MKKTYVLLCMLLCLSMVFSLTGCKGDDGKDTDVSTEAPTEAIEEVKDPESAEELWERIDETMDSLVSYEGKSTGQFIMYMNGYKFDVAVIGYSIVCPGEKYSYTKNTMDMNCAELSYSVRNESVEAYCDGKMYYSTVNDAYSQMLFSEMTYDEFVEAVSDPTEMDLLDCNSAEFSKNDDGTWELQLSGYTKKTINLFLKESGIADSGMGGDVIDMEVSVLADADFRVNKLHIEMVYDSEDPDALPAIIVEDEFSNFNSAEPNADELKVDEYTEVADVRMLEKVDECLTEIVDAKSGSFVLEVEQHVSFMGEEDEYAEKDTVSFEYKNNSYSFDLEIESTEANATVKYKNGVETVIYDGEEQNVSMTDDEAKTFIEDLVYSVNYDADGVSDIEKTGDDVYVFTMGAPDDSLYVEYFESAGAELDSIQQIITVTMKDGQIYKMESNVTVVGIYNDVASAQRIDMTVTSVLTFGEIVDALVTV